MEELKVRRLPVINKSKRMVGILSLGDVSRSAPNDLLSESSRAFRPITTETWGGRRGTAPTLPRLCPVWITSGNERTN